jgi:predicted amidohydrolase YtcJ
MKMIVFLLLCFAAYTSFAQAPDLILSHCQVIEMGAGAEAKAHAIAIRGDRIIAVGSNEEILKSAGPATIVYDLQDRLVLPGFNDAHYHWMPRPAGDEVRLSGMDPSWSEVLAAIKKAATSSPVGTWIYAASTPAIVNNPRANRLDLDTVAANHPVWVASPTGHGLIISTAAMRRLGLRDDEPDTGDVRYERLPETQRLSGRFLEYTQWIQNRRLAELTPKLEKLKSIHEMSNDAVRFGITSMQIMPTSTIREFEGLLSEAAVPIRIRVMDFTLPGDASWNINADGPPDLDFAAKVRVSGLKWVLDGTPIERGAALRKPYADDPASQGQLNLTPEKLRSVVQRAWKSNDQTLFHVAGDRAAADLLTAMESVGTPSGWRAKRLRMEHGEGILADLLPRAQRLGVLVVQNPIHFDNHELNHARYGTDEKFQPFRSLAANGIPIAIGSDGPMNPYLNIMFATLHPSQPNEAITRVQAVDAYTLGSAYAEFAEQSKGQLAVGEFADITVPSADIFAMPTEALPSVHSVLTIIGGKVEHDERVVKHSERH